MDPRAWGMPFPMIVGALFVIVMLRANATYWVGRAARRGAASTRAARMMMSPAYRRAERLVDRWGAVAVSLCFLTVGVQTMINFVAGASKMGLRRYLPAVAIGSALWAMIYATVGVGTVTAVRLLYERSPGLALGLGAVLGLFVLGYVGWQLFGRSARVPIEVSSSTERRR